MDAMKKVMLIGVGLAAATRDKIEEVIGELVKKGELSEKEGREMAEALLERSKKIKDEMEKKIEKGVADALARLNIPTRKDWSDLKARIEALEKELEKARATQDEP